MMILGSTDAVAGANERTHTSSTSTQQIGVEPSNSADASIMPFDRAGNDSRTSALNTRFLAFEIEIDRAFGDAGAARDVVHAGRRETFLGENSKRGVENLLRPRFLAAAPADGWQETGLAHRGRLLNDRSFIIDTPAQRSFMLQTGTLK